MAGSHHQSCHNSIRLRQGQTIKFNLSNIRIETDAEDMTINFDFFNIRSETSAEEMKINSDLSNIRTDTDIEDLTKFFELCNIRIETSDAVWMRGAINENVVLNSQDFQLRALGSASAGKSHRQITMVIEQSTMVIKECFKVF